MNLTAYRGQSFQEVFTFKNQYGQVVTPPLGTYVVYVQNGSYITSFPATRTSSGVIWSLTAAQVNALPYSTLYFTLTNNGTAVTQGVLTVR